MKTLSNSMSLQKSFRVAVILVALVVACGAASATHAASVFDITFPITELGSCADRVACKAYCDDANNQSACKSFAEKHSLVVRVQASSSTKPKPEEQGKLQAIKKDGGPGQCASGSAEPLKACQAYCSDATHIQECVTYAQNHKIMTGEQLKKAQQISAVLKSGASLPEGCTDAASCKQVCERPTSVEQARSCFEFARAAGILPPGFKEENAKKFFGNMRGATSSGMGERVMPPMSGPGGCKTPEECKKYCAENEDECKEFAESHPGMPAMRPMLPRPQNIGSTTSQGPGIPPGIKDCIIAAIGQDAFATLLTNTAAATTETKNAVRTCMEQQRPATGMGMPGNGSSTPMRPRFDGPQGNQQGNQGEGMGAPGMQGYRGVPGEGVRMMPNGGPGMRDEGVNRPNRPNMPMRPGSSSPTSFMGLIQQMAAVTFSFGSKF